MDEEQASLVAYKIAVAHLKDELAEAQRQIAALLREKAEAEQKLALIEANNHPEYERTETVNKTLDAKNRVIDYWRGEAQAAMGWCILAQQTYALLMDFRSQVLRYTVPPDPAYIKALDGIDKLTRYHGAALTPAAVGEKELDPIADHKFFKGDDAALEGGR